MLDADKIGRQDDDLLGLRIGAQVFEAEIEIIWRLPVQFQRQTLRGLPALPAEVT
jgi:predicted ThiF/HesA family dinucleotide-utilizing enzyme